MTRFGIHPIVSVLTIGSIIVGSFITRSLMILLLTWAMVLVGIVLSGHMRRHLAFVVTAFVPLGLMLVFVWWYLIGAPPGAPNSSDPLGGLQYALLLLLRMLLITSAVQLTFLTLRIEHLPQFLHACGVRRGLLASVVGAFALLLELQLRADQVLTARLARGLVTRVTPIAKARQLPAMLAPLLAWTLRSSIQRTETWQSRDLLQNLETMAKRPFVWSTVGTGVMMAVALFWLCLCMVTVW